MKHLHADTVAGQVSLELQDFVASGRWYFDRSHLKLDNLNTRIAIDTAPIAIALCNLAGDLQYANWSCKQLLGITSLEAVIGKNLIDIAPSLFGNGLIDGLATTSEVQRHMLVVDRGGVRSERIFCQTRRVDGAEQIPRWLVFTLTVLSDFVGPGQTDALVDEFSEAEKRAGIAYWSIPFDESIPMGDLPMVWSPGVSHLFFLRKDQQIACCRDWLAEISPGDRLTVRQSLIELARDGRAFDIEYHLLELRGNGRKVIRSRGWRVSREDARSGYMLVGTEEQICRDYDKDEELRRVMSLFKSMYDASDWVAGLVDEHMRLVYCNHALRGLWSNAASLEDFGVMNLQELLLDVDTRRSVMVNIRRALNGQRRAQTIEYDSGGAYEVCVDLNFNPVKIDQKEIIGVSIIGNILPTRRHGPGVNNG